MTLAGIQLNLQGKTFMGYLMDDGSVQFLVRSEMRTFSSLIEAARALLDTY